MVHGRKSFHLGIATVVCEPHSGGALRLTARGQMAAVKVEQKLVCWCVIQGQSNSASVNLHYSFEAEYNCLYYRNQSITDIQEAITPQKHI
ncbi:hypothetical protein E2542_SST22860 [Spatholobus suberectus]|nr:hypothetical protein E2542_SST22860 [Spatholobus suberectus]